MSDCSKCVYESHKCVGKCDKSEKIIFYNCKKGHDVDATQSCKDYKEELL